MRFDDLKKRCAGKTLLGVGPVTKNTINAAIRIVNTHNIPLQLIPSRRQVEAKLFGGGYVMDTESFSKYVKSKDKFANIILARDHGGPYQGSNIEPILEVSDAIESYEVDIKNDFDVLHIDPSLNPEVNHDFTLLREQISQLLYNCEDEAAKQNKQVYYEVGTDGHGTKPSDINEMKILVEYILKNHNDVKFLVANTGTCVKEKCNVGRLHIPQTLEFIELCDANGLMLKEHNNDYNLYSTLEMHRKLGVHSSNIAPEYGVEETKAFLELLQNFDLYREYEDFIRLAYESKKWEKWMINGEHPDKEYLATICGHYIMQTPEVIEIKKELDAECLVNGCVPVDEILTMAVETKIIMHLRAFGWNV